MKIIDCFIFYNEYNILLLRFTELYEIVNQFVIVEATSTHSGKKKELNETFRSTMQKVIKETQTSRTTIVGCSDETIHRTFHATCSLLEEWLSSGGVSLFGGAAISAAEFALYGQMSQWNIDRTVAEMLPTKYPRTFAWLWNMEDQSGTPDIHSTQANGAPAFVDITEGTPNVVRHFLELIGKTYLPFLVANRQARRKQKKTVSVEIFNGEILHTQPPFGYQDYCYTWLQESLNQVEQGPQLEALIQLLQETKCLDFFSIPSVSKM